MNANWQNRISFHNLGNRQLRLQFKHFVKKKNEKTQVKIEIMIDRETGWKKKNDFRL